MQYSVEILVGRGGGGALVEAAMWTAWLVLFGIDREEEEKTAAIIYEEKNVHI